MKQNVTLVSPTQTPKYAVNENTMVNIDLSGGPTTNRISVHEILTFKELGIDPTKTNVTEAPAFPSEKIAEISKDPSLDGAARSKAIDALLSDYKTATANHAKNNTGVEIEDLINVAVMNFLVEKKGFSRKDTASKAYIAANELLVNSFVAGDMVIFKVTGTAIWG